MKVKSTIILFLFLLLMTINTASAVTFYESDADYGFSNGVMTDNTNLTYETNIDGVVTVNDERFLAFALKGTYAGTEYTYTSMDYDWTWTHTVDGTNHTFEAINNNDNFVWKQYWYFHENEPLKIEHYLKNNYPQAITDMEMYYLTTVNDTDTIQYDGNDYPVGDVKPLFIQEDLNNVDASINFNDEYDFNFLDIVSEGFDINEFYLGSGSVIGYPAIDIMAVGFTKNNGVFPSGAEVWIDPTFSTNLIGGTSLCPLDNNTIVLVWGDTTSDQLIFSIYDINETVKVGPVIVDSSAGNIYDEFDVLALNSTHFVIGWYDEISEDASFSIYNTEGSLITGPVDMDSSAGTSSKVRVAVLNSTNFVVNWYDDIDETIKFSTYDTGGNLKTGPFTVSSEIYSTSMEIASFNETHFVVGWHNYTPDGNATFSIYDIGGNIVNGPVIVATAGTGSFDLSVSVLNETHFVIVWHDDVNEDVTYAIYDTGGNLKTGPVDIDTVVGSYAYLSSTAIKSSETKFITAWSEVSSQDAYASMRDGASFVFKTMVDGYCKYTSNSISITSYDYITGIGLVDDTFVVAYRDSVPSNIGLWIAYNSDGSLYDAKAPIYASQSYSDNTSEADCDFSIQYSDNVELDSYIFATNNTGVWVNDSAVAFTTNPETITTTKTLNSTLGLTVGYRWYANDTTGLENNTPIYTLLTGSDVTGPTHSGATTNTTAINYSVNFTVDINDNIALESNGQYMFSTNNSGTWVNSSWSNFTSTPETICNNTLILPSDLDTTVGYRWYLQDNAGNWDNSSIFTVTTALWGSNVAVINGLVDVGSTSNPDVFYNLFGDSKWHMIAGEFDGVFNGYHWNGTGWESNATVKSGLVDVGYRSAPDVFYNLFGDSKWHMIAGESDGVFNGYQWTGSAWTSNATVISGLVDVGSRSTPTVFYNLFDDSKWHMISGEDTGVFNGYKWNGTGWDSNSTVMNGLVDVGQYSTLDVFYNLTLDDKWHMIAGENDGVFNGYQWNGTGWESDSSLVSGLVDVGYASSPDVFYNLSGNDKWYLISGEEDGVFNGFESIYVSQVSPAVAPVVTLLSQSPGVIYQNSTGFINISYGISHDAAGLNNTSVSFIYRNYDPLCGCSNHSIRPPANNLATEWDLDGRILRAANRNESLNFEDNSTITGGNIYDWSGLDENDTRLTIVPVNSTYTLVYINGTIHDVMPQTWYLDRSDLQEAPKTKIGIYKDHNVLVKLWNLEIFKGNYDYIAAGYTDTDLEDNPALHPSDADPLNYYYVSSGYDPDTDGDPLTSGYAVFMGSGNASEWIDYVYSPHTNSSYVMAFINNTLVHQYINTTNISYVYFTSNTPSSKPFYINVTDVSSSTNVSFADTGTLWAGDTSLSQQHYTPNMWFSFMKDDITFDHKLYVADNNDLWDNSTLNSTVVGLGKFPPTTPTFHAFHNGFTDYDMNGTYYGTIQVQIGVASDPDGGNVTHVMTSHYSNGTLIEVINNATYPPNGVFTNVSFDTTPYSPLENYTLRLVATDDENESVTVWLGVNFTINYDNFTFSNAAITPSAIRERESFIASIDISDTDGTITEAIVTINGNNYTMTAGAGDTWSYTYSNTIVVRYFTEHFYAKDNFGAWNSTSSSLYIDAVSSGGGGGGGVVPTPTPTPIVNVSDILPDVNITEFVTDITDAYQYYTTGNYETMWNINVDNENKTYSKIFYVTGPTACEILENSTFINSCVISDNTVTVSMDFVPTEHGLFATGRDYVEITAVTEEIYYINMDIWILNLPVLYTVENAILALIVLAAALYFKRRNKR